MPQPPPQPPHLWAVSPSGPPAGTWHFSYTGVAYTSATKFTDGTETTFGYCERPHLVFDTDGVTPVALTNGVKMGAMPGMQNDDQSYTLLRPLKRDSAPAGALLTLAI